MATRHDGGHYVEPTENLARTAATGNQWELEGCATDESTTETGRSGSECDEDSMSMLWEDESSQESVQTLAQGVQQLWEAGASLDCMFSWTEPGDEDQAFGSE